MHLSALPRARALKVLVALALCVAFIPVVPASAVIMPATTWYVNASSGNDANSGISAEAAFEHIGWAIGAASEGDTIIVAPGTYADEEWPLSVDGALTFESSGSAEDTILDAGGTAQHFSIMALAPVSFTGFTFVNGVGETGGAINCSSTELYLDGCVFRDNTASVGAAIWFSTSGLYATDCSFESNGEEVVDQPFADVQPQSLVPRCDEGGAIYAVSASVNLTDTDFVDNGAYFAAPAVFLGGCESSVSGCGFYHNQVTTWVTPGDLTPLEAFKSESKVSALQSMPFDGGAITAVETWIEVDQSTFTENLALGGAGVASISSAMTLTGCDFTDNASLLGAVASTYGPAVGSVLGYELTGMPNRLSAQRAVGLMMDRCTVSGTWSGESSVYLDDYAMVTNCVFTGNGYTPDYIEGDPPAMTVVAVGSSMLRSTVADSVATVEIENCTIADNYSETGIFSAIPFGAGLYNTIVWNGMGEDSTSTVNLDPQYCDLDTPPGMNLVPVGTQGAATWFSEEPQFMDPDVGDYSLKAFSPCVDTGTEAVDHDFLGVARPIDGNEDGTAEWDVGAYEYDPWSDTRLGGDDRYETSVDVSQRHFPEGSDVVVIATGAKFADGLAASGLAGLYNAPLLLTEPDHLPQVVADEIERLGANRVIVTGREMAVSDQVIVEIVDLGVGEVDRIGGVDRYETAAFIAGQIIEELGEGYDGTYFVARGDLFADALTASPVAWANQTPILLVKPDEMPEATVDVITSLGGGRAIIVGGTSAVGTNVEAAAEDQAASTERITGTDRYDTSAEFSMWAVDQSLAMWDAVGVATGEKFPDALSGGPGIGTRNGVVLLTPATSMHTSIETVVGDHASSIISLEVFGGPSAVSDDVYQAFMDLLAP